MYIPKHPIFKQWLAKKKRMEELFHDFQNFHDLHPTNTGHKDSNGNDLYSIAIGHCLKIRKKSQLALRRQHTTQ